MKKKKVWKLTKQNKLNNSEKWNENEDKLKVKLFTHKYSQLLKLYIVLLSGRVFTMDDEEANNNKKNVEKLIVQLFFSANWKIQNEIQCGWRATITNHQTAKKSIFRSDRPTEEKIKKLSHIHEKVNDIWKKRLPKVESIRKLIEIIYHNMMMNHERVYCYKLILIHKCD